MAVGLGGDRVGFGVRKDKGKGVWAMEVEGTGDSTRGKGFGWLMIGTWW